MNGMALEQHSHQNGGAWPIGKSSRPYMTESGSMSALTVYCCSKCNTFHKHPAKANDLHVNC